MYCHGDGNLHAPRRYSRRELMRRAAALGVSVPTVSLLLAACRAQEGAPSQATTAPSATTPTSAPVVGTVTATPQGVTEPSGQIVIVLADEPLTLENWNAFSIYGHPILRNVMEALINRDPQTNELVPELALSWERVDDLTWRFTLRQGVTFHNGEEFTAEVAAYGLNYTWDPDNGFEILAIIGPEITATAVDKYTLDVKTAAPDPILPARLYFSPIPSMKQLQEDPESAKDNPIGTGPYKFVEWIKGQHVRLTANPDWWGHTASDARGRVAIKDVEFQFRKESTVRAAQISTGEAHLTHNLAPEDCETVPVCKSEPSIETVILRIDTMHVAMKDKRVRQAIAQAINVEGVANELFAGLGQVATQIYGPMALGYNPDLKPYPYDLEGAKRLIEEARADGVPVDAPITIVTSGGTPRSTELVQYVAEQLKQIGLNATSQVLEAAQYRPQVYGTPQDQVPPDRGWITLIQHGNELMDASASINRYYSCNPDSDSTFCNTELEQKIQEATKLEGEDREQAYKELGRLLYDEYAIIPIVHLNINYGMVESLVWEPRIDGFMLVKEMSFS